MFSRVCIFYRFLMIAEESGVKIGLFRTLCSVVGGLFVSYTVMTLTVLLIPSAVGQGMIVAYLFTPFLWACAALWISLSLTRFQALLRATVPAVLCSLACFLFL